jgi:hypothetical protein
MKGESQRAIDFLQKFYPKGPWLLTSIQTDRKAIDTKPFGPKSIEECMFWLEKYNGDRNIYFTVNQPNIAFLKSSGVKKPNKEDMFEAHWLHVDIDPAEASADEKDMDGFIKMERERILSVLTDRLPKGIEKPTVIIFSGGGYQAFWKLDKPFRIDGTETAWSEFELYNKRLEQVFGGDHCHNVDRIMRLPGTVNVPDAKKRKKGRTEQLAKLLEFDKKNSYSIEDFKKAQAVQTSGPGRHDGGEYGIKVDIPGNVEKIADLSELDVWDVPDRVKVIIAQGQHPDQPKEGDNSRSAWLFDCVCSLARCNVPDGVIFAILTDPEWGIASSIVELKGGAEKYAIRQIKRAKEYSEDPHLTMMNDRHAIIGNIGGKCRVIEEIEDDVLHRSRITMSSFEDVRNRYGNIQIQIGSTDKGDPVHIPLGKYWINHRMRRQYDTMKFMPQGDQPGVYNLWRGFNVEPIPGDCSIYLEHLKQNVCSGNEGYYDYLIKWMARVVQTPASPGEVAIVLRGGKGTGKGYFARTFGRLFGRHHLHVANPSHLVGNFNAHLRDVISLFADEAFFAGDKRHESVLKMLITEDSIPIEAKGIDTEPYPNYVHLIMASNDPHVIRATGDERRYFVLDMGDGRKQDSGFFKSLTHQMDNGGYEALLYHLQNVDMTDFEVRNVPQTEALNEQKLMSMGVEEEWWYHKLWDGYVLEGHDSWMRDVQTELLEKDYTNYADKWKFARRGNATLLGRFLKSVIPHINKMQKRVTVEEYDQGTGGTQRTKKRLYHYDLGSLEQCRISWDKVYGVRDWPSPVELDLEDMEVPF